jgi:hypothetical protein
MKQIIVSILVVVVLLKVLFNSADTLTKIIILPFLIFAVGFGLKRILILLKKEKLASIFSKICTIAFLIYWFGFLIYWDYANFIRNNYVEILFSIPFWLGGIYLIYKRLFKK